MASYSARGTVSVRPFVTVEGVTAEGQQTPVRSQDQWRRLQVLVVALCFLLNMLDGMDVLILSISLRRFRRTGMSRLTGWGCCSVPGWRAWPAAACGWPRWPTVSDAAA
jgi:hypothetical protein